MRVWTFPSNTSDQVPIRTVKDKLANWNLNRVIRALDREIHLRGQPPLPPARRRALHRRGEAARGLQRGRRRAVPRRPLPHRGRQPAGKEVRVDDGAARDQIITALQDRIDGSDTLSAGKRAELAGRLKTKPAFARFLRATSAGLLRIDRAKVRADAHLDGKFLLRTSDESLTAADIAAGYKGLYEAERGLAGPQPPSTCARSTTTAKTASAPDPPPAPMAALLLRVAETTVGDTWRNIREELVRMHLIALATSEGHVAQRSELTHASGTSCPRPPHCQAVLRHPGAPGHP